LPEGKNDMKFTKLDDKGILLTPQTAAKENPDFPFKYGDMSLCLSETDF
jgi:hypothetical protein